MATFCAILLIVTLCFAGIAQSEETPSFSSVQALFQADAPMSMDQISYERGKIETVESRFFEARELRSISLMFTSQVYRGITATHRALLFLPNDRDPLPGVAAVKLGGRLLDVPDADHDWIEHTTLGLGVPSLVILDVFDAKAFGAKNAGELMSFGDRTFVETGDAREYGYYAIARIFSAAATMLGDLEEVNADRVLVSGGSKGGMAAMIACVGDPRIVGCYSTALNGGNLVEFTRLKGERWGWDVKPKPTGPAGEPAAKMLAMLSSPAGKEMMRLFDPISWGELLNGKFVMPAVGTNDPLFHLLSDQFYFDDLKANKALLRIPNTGHGGTQALHARGWRFAAAAALLGQKVPSVKIREEESEGKVSVFATVIDAVPEAKLTLWAALDASGDYRDAKWTARKELQVSGKSEEIHVDDLKKTAAGTISFFALLEETDKRSGAVLSSNIVEVGNVVRRPMPSKSKEKPSSDAQEQSGIPAIDIREDQCPVEWIRTKASDGEDAIAMYRKPPGSGPFPAVVIIHGGLFQAKEERLRSSLIENPVYTRLLASGFVTVASTFRTYADEPQDQGPILDNLAVVAAVKGLPFVDGESVVAFGGSGGGSIVLDLAGQSHLAAAICGEPATLLFNGMLNSGDRKLRNAIMENPFAYQTPETEALTAKKVGKIGCPVLILHGDVHVIQKMNKGMLVPALEAANVVHEYRVYPGNPHGFYFGGRTTEETVDQVVSDVINFVTPRLKTPLKRFL